MKTKPLEPNGSRLSAEFAKLHEMCRGEQIRLRDLLANLGGRSHALPPLIFALPFLLPIPVPGLSVIFGAVIIMSGLAMALDRPPWLPRRLLDRSISTTTLLKIFELGRKWSAKLEKIVRPRGRFISAHPWVRPFNGFAIAICGFLMALPLPPGTNFPPACAIILLAIASLEEDTVVLAIGYVAFLINLVLFGGLVLMTSVAFAQNPPAGPGEPGAEPQKTSDALIKTDPKIDAEIAEHEKPVGNPLAIRRFETNYFISGKPDTKVQLSFQYQLFEKHPIVFGYTQAMFWELYKENSSPFSDINFRPQLFYRFDNNGPLLKTLEAGYAHTSNGEAGAASRSIDRLFGRFNWGQRFVSSVTAYYYFGVDKNNKDIVDYVGPIEAQLQLKKLVENVVSLEDLYLRLYTGGKFSEDFSRTSYEIGLRFLFSKNRASPGLFVQYFRGYNEKILDYDKERESYRIGFSLGE